MQRAAEVMRPTKGPTPFVSRVLSKAIDDLERAGLTLAVITHEEFSEANKKLAERGWYHLHDHYNHERFLGLAITDLSLESIHAIHASRPLDLGSRSLGEALGDLKFPYVNGVPVGANDRFDQIPLAAYCLKGMGSYLGGLWIDPRARQGAKDPVGAGLQDSLLSYMTRSTYAYTMGMEDPDFFFCFVVDLALRGRAVNKSILDRYGWKYVAPGPIWVNHYDDPTASDLKFNTTWIDRAAVMAVLCETPWIAPLLNQMDIKLDEYRFAA